jgi:FkbM family methyltransferase
MAISLDGTNNSIVIIGICNLNVDISVIEKSLLNHKVQRFINPVQFCIMLERSNIEFSNYWLTSDLQIYETNYAKIREFRSILEDEDSRLEYDGILSYRITGDTASLRKPRGLHKQYLAADLGTPPKNMRILELGAFQGEDLIRFIDNSYVISCGILLEPDMKNFQNLIREIRNRNIQNVIPLPVGAWDETTTMRFESNGKSGSRISSDGDDLITVIRPDDIFYDLDFNYIKMDIEGNELEALKGLKRIITVHAPHLAISVYHKPMDLWEIGLFLHKNFPDRYKFYLRTYGYQSFDSVLHAIPINKL